MSVWEQIISERLESSTSREGLECTLFTKVIRDVLVRRPPALPRSSVMSVLCKPRLTAGSYYTIGASRRGLTISSKQAALWHLTVKARWTVCVLFFLILSQGCVYWFERERKGVGGEGERETMWDKHRLVASCTRPDPLTGDETETFWCMDDIPTNWATQPGPQFFQWAATSQWQPARSDTHRELWRCLIVRGFPRGRRKGQLTRALLNLCTQEKSGMDDQEVKSSHSSK